ncbi:MAG: hypothetical protein RJA07_984 [Bacteroidota bacterium]|jgi:four helix bundle protein
MNENSFRSFEDLECWKVCREFRMEMSSLCKKFPAEEKYKLSDQLIRSSRSVTANIAEGYGLYTFQENAKFCRDARGSLTESLDHLIVALDEKYIDEKEFTNYKEKYQKCLALLNGYIAYLIKSKSNSTNNK